MSDHTRVAQAKKTVEDFEAHIGHTIAYRDNGSNTNHGVLMRVSYDKTALAVVLWLETESEVLFPKKIFSDQAIGCQGEHV